MHPFFVWVMFTNITQGREGSNNIACVRPVGVSCNSQIISMQLKRES